MGAVVDDECGDAQTFRAFHQNRQAKLEGRIGEAAIGIDLHDRRTVVLGHIRCGIGLHLAGLDGAQCAFNAVNAMGLAGVALTGGDDARQRSRLHGI
ncbi:hypothetical protein D3C72_640500 [compost metagenome]